MTNLILSGTSSDFCSSLSQLANTSLETFIYTLITDIFLLMSFSLHNVAHFPLEGFAMGILHLAELKMMSIHIYY